MRRFTLDDNACLATFFPKVGAPAGTIITIVGEYVENHALGLDYIISIPGYPNRAHPHGLWACRDRNLEPVTSPDVEQVLTNGALAAVCRDIAASRPEHLSHADIGTLLAYADALEREPDSSRRPSCPVPLNF